MKRDDPDDYLVGNSEEPEESGQPDTLDWLQHADELDAD